MARVVWIMALAMSMSCLVAGAVAQTALPLVIVEDTLPAFDAGVEVHLPLHARGGVPPYRWKVAAGELPEGIALIPEGFLAGRPAKPGGFTVTLSVEDSADPANRINKEFSAKISASLVFEWLHPPQAAGTRIDGVAQVSNGAKDDFDLTVVVVAVNETGRATALGYQHFMLKAGLANLRIPFGTTLPHGAYVVQADAVAEIPARNAILRRQLETPAPLPVTQGP